MNNQYPQNMQLPPKQAQPEQLSILDINNEFQRLWFEHIIWTKIVITSMANNSNDTQIVTARLLKNPDDFKDLFTYFYGPEVGTKFGNLLKEHLIIAADLVNAAKRNDTNAMAMIERKWYQNADDIAKLLSSINPNWTENEIKQMMYAHLNLVKQEAVAILTNNYAEMISIFDKMEEQALNMSDMFFEGIVKQFFSNPQRLHM